MSNSNNDFLNSLIIQRDKLQAQLDQINNLIATMGGIAPSAPPVTSGNSTNITSNSDSGGAIVYDRGQKTRWKVIFVIKNKNRFLHSSEIRKEIARLDGVEYDSVNISATLSNLKGDGKIVKVQVGKQNRNSFWGSPKWLDGEGKIFPKHIYDKSQLSTSDTVDIDL